MQVGLYEEWEITAVRHVEGKPIVPESCSVKPSCGKRLFIEPHWRQSNSFSNQLRAFFPLCLQREHQQLTAPQGILWMQQGGTAGTAAVSGTAGQLGSARTAERCSCHQGCPGPGCAACPERCARCWPLAAPGPPAGCWTCPARPPEGWEARPGRSGPWRTGSRPGRELRGLRGRLRLPSAPWQQRTGSCGPRVLPRPQRGPAGKASGRTQARRSGRLPRRSGTGRGWPAGRRSHQPGGADQDAALPRGSGGRAGHTFWPAGLTGPCPLPTVPRARGRAWCALCPVPSPVPAVPGVRPRAMPGAHCA
ncbi:translation initiation factor IF-2-like [Vidua macroura]|uniref:translation initiation factor IF-2-like n=1 Tax=Vidua macroura TaxID=187451 RepID=UPI0023A83D8A|nr:translation initiation factor IF-2-like [Vidua macroura]